MSTDTIHTALMDVADEGEHTIALGDGLSLVRPNDQLLSHRWDWAQGKGEMDEEATASRTYFANTSSTSLGKTYAQRRNGGANRFYAGLMAFQVIKPIRTLGFIYRRQQIERRPPMQPGRWAMANKFDAGMLAQVPAMIQRIQPVMDGSNVEHKNALTLLQLGLEHFHPYIAGLLWVTGLEAIFDSGGREEFKKKLCDCLGSQTMAFSNWHSEPGAPPIQWMNSPFLSICSGTS
ncbi:hypothetical protein [Granulicella arctica]|uniref:Uncharacterized protein n=1 Tax=Granulicella arctica TaxID=940613 RepID=A0A7Y9TJL9_9BACT|nr:hypothetical protein [Granulicella arctica]NYF78417.1 hypothetical protein [Granulicella arctica]